MANRLIIILPCAHSSLPVPSAPGVLKFLMLSNNPAVLPSHLSEANTCRLPLPDHFKSFSHVNKDTLDTILLNKVVLRDNGHWSLTSDQSKLYDYSRWYAPILFPSANWSGWQMARWQWLEKSPAVIAISCHLLSPYTCPPYPPVATKRLNCVQQMRRCLLSGAPASLEWFGHQETHWLLASVPSWHIWHRLQPLQCLFHIGIGLLIGFGKIYGRKFYVFGVAKMSSFQKVFFFLQNILLGSERENRVFIRSDSRKALSSAVSEISWFAKFVHFCTFQLLVYKVSPERQLT